MKKRFSAHNGTRVYMMKGCAAGDFTRIITGTSWRRTRTRNQEQIHKEKVRVTSYTAMAVHLFQEWRLCETAIVPLS